jgi:hypothetical protein
MSQNRAGPARAFDTGSMGAGYNQSVLSNPDTQPRIAPVYRLLSQRSAVSPPIRGDFLPPTQRLKWEKRKT